MADSYSVAMQVRNAWATHRSQLPAGMETTQGIGAEQNELHVLVRLLVSGEPTAEVRVFVHPEEVQDTDLDTPSHFLTLFPQWIPAREKNLDRPSSAAASFGRIPMGKLDDTASLAQVCQLIQAWFTNYQAPERVSLLEAVIELQVEVLGDLPF